MFDPASLTRRWQGILAVEGVTVADGRHVARNALTLAPPRPLYVVPDFDVPLSEVVGTIDRIWREGNLVHGEGRIIDDYAAPKGPVPVAIEVGADSKWQGATLLHGSLTGAVLGGESGWPEAVIKIEAAHA